MNTCTETVYFSDLLPVRHPSLFDRMIGVLESNHISWSLIPHTRDIWCRDYMPVPSAAGRMVQFRYAPPYLSGIHETSITHPETVEAFCKEHTGQSPHTSSLIIDGGNIVHYQGRYILTDMIFRHNPGMGQSDILKQLQIDLETDDIIIIPHEPYDLLGHADGMIRFINRTTVLINDYAGSGSVSRSFLRKFYSAISRHGLEMIGLPYAPLSEKTRDGLASAVNIHINFIQTASIILMPIFGTPEDHPAQEIIGRAFPEHTLVSIPATDIAAEGGVLNCVSWMCR